MADDVAFRIDMLDIEDSVSALKLQLGVSSMTQNAPIHRFEGGIGSA
jgi:hypothetical protein